jgi:RNA polymerase sigma-70 factor (ECF subfamily)
MTRSRQRHGPLSAAAPVHDEAWFDDLFRTHHRAVLAFARRRVPEHADDVVGEVFAVAWRRRDEVPAEPLPWLYRTAGNHVLHARRGDARRSRTLAAAAGQGGVDVSAEDPGDRVAAALDSRSLIRAALGALGEADQEVLRLWAWERLEIPQIAYVLGCSGGTTRVRLHRALRRLRAAARAADAAVPHPETTARPGTRPAPIRSEA